MMTYSTILCVVCSAAVGGGQPHHVLDLLLDFQLKYNQLRHWCQQLLQALLFLFLWIAQILLQPKLFHCFRPTAIPSSLQYYMDSARTTGMQTVEVGPEHSAEATSVFWHVYCNGILP